MSRCEATSAENGVRCTRDAHDDGYHRNQSHGWWTPGRCGYRISDMQCALRAGHQGLHVPGDYEPAPDLIDSPPHYTHGAIEPIDAVEAWGLNHRLSCVVKYIARHEHKGSALRDLEKARWYLDREIAKRKEAGGES